MSSRTVGWCCVALFLPAVLVGCSEVKGIEVAGDLNPAYMATAATDVLIASNVTIRQVPVCTSNSVTPTPASGSPAPGKSPGNYLCQGLTQENVPINVTVTNANNSNANMVITVGGQQIFSGSPLTVIDDNAEAAP